MKRIPLLLLLFVCSCFGSQAQTVNPKTPSQPSAAEKYFGNTELLNQDGRTVRFYDDVLHGKVVVIDVFFSTCQSICTPMNRTVKKVADLLADRVGRDVFLVSITVDPEMDSAAVLKKYASALDAPAGWMFLTGSKENVEVVLKKLGQYVADKNDHSSVLIIGNETTGLWKKAYGLAPASELVKVIESVINDKGP